jgi:hypothetical protein
MVEPAPWPHAFICGMYESLGSRARMLRAHLDSDASLGDRAEERQKLLRAVELVESAQREVGDLLSADARSALPGEGYGTYLGDEIGAVLMRIKDYSEGISGIAHGLHAYESELTDEECNAARATERLLAEADHLLGG